jgi:hypothetical protein
MLAAIGELSNRFALKRPHFQVLVRCSGKVRLAGLWRGLGAGNIASN